MSRIAVIFMLSLTPIFFSSFASAAYTAPTPFLVCTENQSPAKVQVSVARIHNNSMVRVEIRETSANGNRVVTLNDIYAATEQNAGVFQNRMFRLKVGTSLLQNGRLPARIQFLLDQGVRATYHMSCSVK